MRERLIRWLRPNRSAPVVTGSAACTTCGGPVRIADVGWWVDPDVAFVATGSADTSRLCLRCFLDAAGRAFGPDRLLLLGTIKDGQVRRRVNLVGRIADLLRLPGVRHASLS